MSMIFFDSLILLLKTPSYENIHIFFKNKNKVFLRVFINLTLNNSKI